MTAQKHDLLDLIETAISDSMDMDWTPRLGAEHVYRAMEREGLIQRLEAFPVMLDALRQMVANSEADKKSYRDCHKKAVKAIALVERSETQAEAN